MTPFILHLSDISATLETTGGKGLSLTKMVNAGLPVPDGFHVTTQAYRQFVEYNGLQACILAALQGVSPTDTTALEAASRAIAQDFHQAPMPAAIAAAVAGAYAAMHDAPVAVRSSATAEDLPDASFAGQQETYLNIRGSEAVLAAVKKCWASLWTARAIAYRLNNQIDQSAVALAVVVQELVFADAAGILFTANPLNGRRGELVINAAWGLGEAVVSGAVTPDTLTVAKDGWRVVRREIAEKQVMTVRTEDGTLEMPVPEPKKKQPVLTGAQITELARLGVQIEQFYGMPMDVEWALAENRFSIVQARPITALPMEWPVPPKGVVYARGSLAEHTPSPVTPLFETLGLAIANEATAQMWTRVLGRDSKFLLSESGFYQSLNGYVYGGMRMDGKTMFSVTRMSLSMIAPIFRGSVARWREARARLEAVVDEWSQKDIAALTPTQLMEGVHAVFGAACRYFTDIQTTLPAASSSEVLFTQLYNRLIRRKQDPEPNVFLLGSDTTALRSEKSLWDLSQWIQTEPALAAFLAQTPGEELAAMMQQPAVPAAAPAAAWTEFRQRFEQHLRTFGRTAYEFDFANPTPLETPGPMLDALKAFLSGKASDPYERQKAAVAKRDQAAQAVLGRVGWPRKGWFAKLLRWAQETSPMREDSIFDMGMGHALLRAMFAELGARFAAGGAIEQPEDIYWLVQHEVESLIASLEAGEALPALADRIPERRARWQRALKETPPVMLPERSGWSKLMHGGEVESKDGKTTLKGVGTSGGKVTAPARVIFGPEDFASMQPGDVLVAVTTTPAWTPLFSLASAVVTDIGGPLSHSSIVAREYGIPAVMAARKATRAIQSGQMITVNGSDGTVTIEG